MSLFEKCLLGGGAIQQPSAKSTVDQNVFVTRVNKYSTT